MGETAHLPMSPESGRKLPAGCRYSLLAFLATTACLAFLSALAWRELRTRDREALLLQNQRRWTRDGLVHDAELIGAGKLIRTPPRCSGSPIDPDDPSGFRVLQRAADRDWFRGDHNEDEYYHAKYWLGGVSVDQWHHRVYYRCPGPIHKDGWDLISCGPNGVYEEGQGDDIVVGEDLPGGLEGAAAVGSGK